MSDNFDLAWYLQIRSRINELNQRVNFYNQKLAGVNEQAFVCVIDALNDNTIRDLEYRHEKLNNQKFQYKKLYLFTEQPNANITGNVELHALPKEFYGIYYVDDIPVSDTISKDYNCFLNRIDPIRQTWFYLLYNRNLLDCGAVSFNMDTRIPSPLQRRVWDQLNGGKNLSADEQFEKNHADYLSSFDSIKDQIKSIIPYKSFVDMNNQFLVVLSTKFSIVIEPYFERTECQVLSEKTFRVLQLPRPWLLFAATGTVKKLRDFGFDVYDDIVDHSYDNFDTAHLCVERQESILTQASQLINMEMSPSLLNRLQQGATHNRQILKDWNSRWRDLCFECIDDVFEPKVKIE